MTVKRAFEWRNNGHLIADVAGLGYIGGHVLDATYGEGGFWSEWRPESLVCNDLYKSGYREGGGRWVWGFDVRRVVGQNWAERFDTVVWDPPYKLSGTPALGQFDERFGVDRAMRWQDRMALIVDGAVACASFVKEGGTLLVKCQDQVCSGRVRWQSRDVAEAVEKVGLWQEDRFDYIREPQPQPAGRRQVHAQANTSQLLVFRKGKG